MIRESNNQTEETGEMEEMEKMEKIKEVDDSEMECQCATSLQFAFSDSRVHFEIRSIPLKVVQQLLSNLHFQYRNLFQKWLNSRCSRSQY
jgi:hypothetical protein